MERRQLSECSAITARDAAAAPHVQALRGKRELPPHNRGANGVDQGVMGVTFGGHAPLYLPSVYKSSALEVIEAETAMSHISGMDLGERLTAAWKRAGFKNERQAALACDVSPQRFNSWTNQGKVPDRLTLARVARVLKTTPSELLNEPRGEGLKDILVNLFGLAGIHPDTADTLATAVIEATRLYEAFPDDSPVETRATHAAHAAWRLQQSPESGT